MLVATNLTRRFGKRIAVDCVSLRVRAGEVLALVGPNGSGKTTTLRMLAGLIEPSSGQVTIDGHRLTPSSAPGLRSRIGFLTESPGLWDRLTVLQNLSVHARLQGVTDVGGTVAAAMSRFGVSDRADQPAAALSKGLRQRVALARTLLHQPTIVLLDEPTSGLDPEHARDVRAVIRELRDHGTAVLLSTHRLDEVERVADTVGVLRTSLLALDSPTGLRRLLGGVRVRIRIDSDAARFVAALQSPGMQAVACDGHTLLVTCDNVDAATPWIVERLVAGGARIHAVQPEDRSLEEAYLQLVKTGVHV